MKNGVFLSLQITRPNHIDSKHFAILISILD